MTIYLTTSKLTTSRDKDLLKQIEEILKKNNCKVLGNNSNKFSPEKLIKRTEREIREQYRRISANIRKSNAFIALITEQSAEIGKEISEAVQEKIPTLILFSEKTKNLQLPKKERKLIRYKIVTGKNIEIEIEKFLQEISKNISPRFTLVIPSNIDKYINWLAKEKGVSKASLLRDAVNEIKENSGQYQKYLQQEE